MIARKPRKGDRIQFGDGSTVTVSEVEDNNIVHCQYSNGGWTSFIWFFPSDGQMNTYATIIEKSTP